VILDYQMHSLTTVEMVEPGLWRIITRTDDTLFSTEVELEVKTPALDIRKARLELKRDVLGIVPDPAPLAEKLVGVRVGPGMTKIVRGTIGGDAGSDRIAELILEAMEMLVNGLTTPELRKATDSAGVSEEFPQDGPKVCLNDVVIGDEHAKTMAQNPRLKDSCVAFRDL
jgi:hypothetical protein